MTLSIDTVSYRLLPRMTGMDVDNKKLGHLKFLTAAGPQKLPKTKWKWRNDCPGERNLCNCVKKAEKNSGLQRGLNPWPRDYRCDALPTELWSHWRWEQVSLRFACVASVSVRFRSKEQVTRVKDRAKNGASKRAGREVSSRSIFRAAKTENPVACRSSVFLCFETRRETLAMLSTLRSTREGVQAHFTKSGWYSSNRAQTFTHWKN